MKLAELQIDRFGVWQKLTLPLNENGLSVLYGPNGTGKSTLLEFVRGVLFGYSPESLKKLPAESTAAGTVWLSTHNELLAVSRRADLAHQLDAVEIEGGTSGDVSGTQRLRELLAEVSPELWDGVFCVGLNEIQELNALSGERVSAQIFEAAQGPDGRRILSAVELSRIDRSRLGQRGQLEADVKRLLAERRQTIERLRIIDSEIRPERFAERDRLQSRVVDLEAEVATHRRRHRSQELRNQLSGPLELVRQRRRELDAFSPVANFPDQGLERLREIDLRTQRLTAKARRHQALLKQSLGFESRSGLSQDEAAALRGFVAQKEWFAEVARQRATAAQRFCDHAAELESLRQVYAANWSDEGLRGLDHSAEAGAELAQLGAALRSARLRHARLKKISRRLDSRACELREAVEDGRSGLPAESIDAALDSARSRLDVVPQAAALKARESTLRDQLRELTRRPAEADGGQPLPAWLSMAVAVFFFAGIVIAGWGFVAGVTTSALAGLIYVFMGLAFGGIAWGLKSQYETDRADQSGFDVKQRAAVERELHAVRRELQAIDAKSVVNADAATASTRAAAAEVTRLSELANRERELQHLEQQQRKLRQRFRAARAELLSARDAWLEKLRSLGLEPTLSVDEVVQGWNGLGLVARQLAARDEIASRCESLEQLWRAVETDIADLSLRTPAPQPTALEALSQIEDWKQLLAVWQEDQLELRERRKSARKSRTILRKLKRRLQALATAKQALWLRAGVTDRTEFVACAAKIAERGAAARLLAEAQAELELLKGESAELAAVCDSLESTDESLSPREMLEVATDLRRLESELTQAHDQLAEADLEIEQLVNDCSAADLRFDLQWIDQKLRAALQGLVAISLAGDVLEFQAQVVERRSQPATLSAASAYLKRLTCERYQRVWTPLTERRLIVEDHEGNSHPVESLSRGAREQLYLAVRLAVIDRLAATGVELPLLLDDVFVNFDQPRTEAAIDLLLEFASRGRQLVFVTCHQHLVQMFRERGVEPTWLPGLAGDTRPDRLAG